MEFFGCIFVSTNGIIDHVLNISISNPISAVFYRQAGIKESFITFTKDNLDYPNHRIIQGYRVTTQIRALWKFRAQIEM